MKQQKDFLTKEGAQVLASKVRAYWKNFGLRPYVRVERITRGKEDDIYVLRSNIAQIAGGGIGR